MFYRILRNTANFDRLCGMDSSQQGTSLQATQEAANLAQIKASKIAFWQTILTIVFGVPTLVLMLLPYLFSGGGSLLIIGPLLIILLSASLALSAVSLIIFALKRLKTKPLIAELKETAGKVDGLLDEKQQLGEELSKRNSENKTLQRQLGETQAAIKQLEGSKRRLPPAPEMPKPKLAFEIDEQNSQIHIERREGVSEITAQLRVRCEKEIDGPMTVRGFRLSLSRFDADGQVTVIPHHGDNQVIWEDTNGTFVAANDGWTIEKPRSDFRYYHLTIKIAPEVQAELSAADHFLQVTMDAIGQEPLSKPVFVREWKPESRYSLISLKPFEEYPPEAQREIDELNEKLLSYEKTNAALGKKNQEYDWLIGDAKEQKADIDKYVSLKEFTFCYMAQIAPTIFRVVFALYVTNNSVLDISLSDELDGTIRFEGIELLEKKRVISPLKDAPHGATRSLTIEQRLSKGEADTIRDAKSKTGQANFEFDDLVVNIIGGSRCPDVKRKSLKIPRNTIATAFPLTAVNRALRIKALSQVWGRCVQLLEPLRIKDEPLNKNVIENWQHGSIDTLKREGYTEDEANRVMQEMTRGEAISETSSSSQRSSIHFYIVVLEDLIKRELGGIHNNPDPPRRLTHQELLRRIEELPVEEKAKAYKAYGELLEQQKQTLLRNTNKS
jgi:hypothetical protein